MLSTMYPERNSDDPNRSIGLGLLEEQVISPAAKRMGWVHSDVRRAGGATRALKALMSRKPPWEEPGTESEGSA